MKTVSLLGLLWLYAASTVAIAVPLLCWKAFTLGLQLSDLLVVLGISGGVLFFPMLFVIGGWWSLRIFRKYGESPTRQWWALLVYSLAMLTLWFIVSTIAEWFEQGSSVSWVVSVSTLLGYSFYLVLPLAAGTGVVAVVAVVVKLLQGRVVPVR